jgi:hypothetical protein
LWFLHVSAPEYNGEDAGSGWTQHIQEDALDVGVWLHCLPGCWV